MRFRMMTILSVMALCGCSSAETQSFSVYFQPYSAALDQQALATVADAADFARSNQRLPVVVTGYSAPPDPKRDIEGLSAMRADAVKQALAADGVGPERITTVASGETDPKPLPNVAVRRVDIAVGRTGAGKTPVAGSVRP